MIGGIRQWLRRRTAARSVAAPGRSYPFLVVSVHDGDTLTALADRGDGDWWLTDVRLVGGNARELKNPGGPEARDHLIELVRPIQPQLLLALVSSRTVRGNLTTAGWDKFGGRVLGRIATPTVPDVMATMIADGYAAPWNGKGAKPVPPWPISQ
jgi:endonuclease YncB( thermonuclease family)